MGSKRTQKNLTTRNSASELTNPLEITILGKGEHETDAKNRTSTNSASKHKPHRNGKKTCQALESLNSDVRDRS